MRALLDTNVIIHRENTKATSFTIGKLCTTAYAFALGSFKRYETSKSLADFNIQSAPQSFVYLDD